MITDLFIKVCDKILKVSNVDTGGNSPFKDMEERQAAYNLFAGKGVEIVYDKDEGKGFEEKDGQFRIIVKNDNLSYVLHVFDETGFIRAMTEEEAEQVKAELDSKGIDCLAEVVTEKSTEKRAQEGINDAQFLKGSSMITNIEIDRILPHKDNPRKDLGDLTELAESIKTNGILQNLTVVPVDIELYQKKINSKKAYPGEYTAVIGHRRLAAAKLAGLTEVPCSVADMDKKTQVATMLLENMQRSDLTVLEQADGLQMMLDLGESIKSASHKTGLSEATIRRRVKLVKEFDRNALERVQGRPIKFEDYEKLYKIKNEETRAEVFEKIGTKDFDWALSSAISSQERAARRSKIHELLSGFATKTTYGEYQKANITKQWDFWRHEPEDVETVKKLAAEFDTDQEYFYTSDTTQTIVYTKDGDRETAAKKSTADAEKRKVVVAQIKDAFAQAYALRVAFARDYKVPGYRSAAVNKMATDALFKGSYLRDGVFRAIFGIEKKFRQDWEKGDSETRDQAITRIMGEMEHSHNGNLLFIGAYCQLEDDGATCADYDGKYEPNKKLERLYEHLTALGYEMSDAERALMDGTHELFVSDIEAKEQDE